MVNVFHYGAQQSSLNIAVIALLDSMEKTVNKMLYVQAPLVSMVALVILTKTQLNVNALNFTLANTVKLISTLDMIQ